MVKMARICSTLLMVTAFLAYGGLLTATLVSKPLSNSPARELQSPVKATETGTIFSKQVSESDGTVPANPGTIESAASGAK